MRFVHTADWQLGMTRRFLGGGGARDASPGEAQARFAADRLEAVRTLGALADAEGAAFVLVCGDVFESNLVGVEVVARACEALRSFTTPVLLLPGNHDPADAASVLRRRDFVRRCPDHVTVLDRPGVHEVAPGVEVVAAPWASKRPLADLVTAAVADLAPAPPGTVRVVAGHGELDVLSPDPDDPKVLRYESLRAAVTDGRAHYVALGDRHSTWSDGTGRVRYPGAPEVTAHHEVEPGNVLLVDVTPAAVEARVAHVGRWRFVAHEATVDNDDDLDALDGWLTACTDKERTAVRLTLTGVLTLRQRTRLDELLDAHRPVFAAVEVHDVHSRLVVRPDDADLASLALSGFAAAAAGELHAAARAPITAAPWADEGAAASDAEEARDALALLHRLVGAG